MITKIKHTNWIPVGNIMSLSSTPCSWALSRITGSISVSQLDSPPIHTVSFHFQSALPKDVFDRSKRLDASSLTDPMPELTGTATK